METKHPWLNMKNNIQSLFAVSNQCFHFTTHVFRTWGGTQCNVSKKTCTSSTSQELLKVPFVFLDKDPWDWYISWHSFLIFGKLVGKYIYARLMDFYHGFAFTLWMWGGHYPQGQPWFIREKWWENPGNGSPEKKNQPRIIQLIWVFFNGYIIREKKTWAIRENCHLFWDGFSEWKRDPNSRDAGNLQLALFFKGRKNIPNVWRKPPTSLVESAGKIPLSNSSPVLMGLPECWLVTRHSFRCRSVQHSFFWGQKNHAWNLSSFVEQLNIIWNNDIVDDSEIRRSTPGMYKTWLTKWDKLLTSTD